MPKPIDLSGTRPPGCSYIVVRLDGTIQFSKPTRAWLCRCDCGAEFRLPQTRIPYAPHIAKNVRRAVFACDVCGGVDCLICGKRLPRSTTRTVCEGACKIEYAKRVAHDYYLRNKELVKKRSVENGKRRRAEGSPVVKAADKRKWERTKADPEKMTKAREVIKKHYHANRDEILAKRRARKAAMSPEQLTQWRAKMRGYQRKFARKRRAALHADPELHAKYLEYMRKYGRCKRPPKLETPIVSGVCCVCQCQIMATDRKKRVKCNKEACRREYYRRLTETLYGVETVQRVCPSCNTIYIVQGNFRKSYCGKEECRKAHNRNRKHRRQADRKFSQFLDLQTKLNEKKDEHDRNG